MAESMKGLKRTCRCAELSEANVVSEVTVMGWIFLTVGFMMTMLHFCF